MKRVNKLEILLIFCIFIVLFLIIISTPLIYRYKNAGLLIINEVMSSNKVTTTDNYGKYSDYIEIYNGYDYEINLKDYYLSDDNFNLKKWSFPDITIKPNDYLVVYATGKDSYEDGIVHTNFKLSQSGEVLTLSNKKANPLSRIYYTKTAPDTSYGYNGKDYVYYYTSTPGTINSLNYSKDPITIGENNLKLSITEYAKDMLELYNGESFDINLENYYLSNDLKEPYKFIFPSVTIKSGSYLVIYNMNKNPEKDKIYTNFIIDNTDKALILSDNHKNVIEKILLKEVGSGYTCGYYNNDWHIYKESSFGLPNKDNYLKDTKNNTKEVVINEVSTSGIELKNLTNEDINLSDYALSDNSEILKSLTSKTLKANSYISIKTSELPFGINNGNETIYLFYNGKQVDEYAVGRLTNNISSGLNSEGKRVYYNKITLGSENSKDYYSGYALNPVFSIDGGYATNGTKVSITTDDNSDIYYTTDGSFPSNKSKKYTGEITITKTTVIKAIAYKDGLLPSDIISRTFFTNKHEIAMVSISTENSNLFGYAGIITNYHQNNHKKISFEFYESDGRLGTSFVGDMKLSGMDSRERDQKSMSVYLRKEYGLKEVTYPFFNEYENTTYSSFLLRNAGEDPKHIRIMDAVLTRTLKGQMDIDMQDYRPVVVYINGSYYGMFNLREKMNADYAVTKFDANKDKIDLVKYMSAKHGSVSDYNNLVNYINSHDPANPDVYKYIKTKIDVEELCNYWIAESYYGNSDLGNIKYWREKDGKWRFMLYDLDWSMWNTSSNMSYPVLNTRIPAVTYVYSSIEITRRLYRNKEFKDLYLTSLAYHLKNTFNPERMNKIVDELAKEIEPEMPKHINRWSSLGPGSVNNWHDNLYNFKQMIKNRYNYVIRNIKSQFYLSNDEYNKYFGELK